MKNTNSYKRKERPTGKKTYEIRGNKVRRRGNSRGRGWKGGSECCIGVQNIIQITIKFYDCFYVVIQKLPSHPRQKVVFATTIQTF